LRGFFIMYQEDFITYLKTEKRYSAHTIKAYQTDLLGFTDYLTTTYETDDPGAVTSPMIRSFVVELMEEGLHPKTVNRKLSTIKSFYRYLRKTGKLTVNPAATINSVKTPKVLVSTVSEPAMEDLFNDGYFKDDLGGARARGIIELLYATGMRRAELIELKKEAIDFSNALVRVSGKRNKTRIVPVTPAALHALRNYLEHPDRKDAKQPYIFLTDKGEKLYPKLVYNIVKRYLSYVTTLRKKSPHVLRHTYATHLLNNGADMNDIKELMGHASLSATQVYTHNSFEQLKSVYNQSHPREDKNE
jgi:integrase/recombinase XerC